MSEYATGIPKPPGRSCEDCAVFHKYNQGNACLIYCMGWEEQKTPTKRKEQPNG